MAVEHFISGNLIAFDTETTGLGVWHGDKPFAFSFANEEGDVRYIEFQVDPFTREVQPDLMALQEMRRVLEDKRVTKVMHNANFDVRMMQRGWGIDVRGPMHDTLFMAHCVDSLEPSYGLKQLSDRYLDYDTEDRDELLVATRQARNIAKKLGWKLGVKVSMDAGTQKLKEAAAVPADYWMPGELACRDERYSGWADVCEQYARKDVERTLLLYHYYLIGFEECDGSRLAYEDELKLWPTMHRMEERGVQIHLGTVLADIKRLAGEAKSWKQQVTKKAWKGFNINSHQQIARLAKKLQLRITDRTDTGKISTTAKVLGKYLSNPTILALFKYRACVSGLRFRYQYQMLRVKDPLTKGWVLHPHYNQVGPATRRLSCQGPNLQNVPIRASAGAFAHRMEVGVRNCFVPRPGYTWYLFDYHQLEVAVFASCSEEPTMLAAIRAGKDLHSECTDRTWGGQDNPASVKACSLALCLLRSNQEPSKAVLKIWRTLGIKERMIPKMTLTDRRRVSEHWLSLFDYSIVRAEASIGVKSSRTKTKMLLFAKIFGGGPNAVKDLLLVDTLTEAQEFLTTYARSFPGVDPWIQRISAEGRRNGYILNIYGHRISVNPQKAYRAANYTVQGSAAALLKSAMVRCDTYLRESGIDGHLVMTIHDEIVFEIHKKWAGIGILLELKRIMEDHGGRLKCGLQVDIDRVRDNWDEKESVQGLGKLSSLKGG